ncbi:sugar ABC transporter permease [Fluviibacterium sp. DFM31]|uniref:Sugar ABC transporter permease n=1 Tax=Meridianimarinicoccus marinus TaxID=3231483 RepID=A0ABV3LBE8_9RHOB
MSEINNRAWFLVLPVLVIVAFNAIIPMMTMVNYSVQDIFGPDNRYFVGLEWYKELLGDVELRNALRRQVTFSSLVLLIQVPLGILIALTLPQKGKSVAFCLIILGLPLLMPWNVVGVMWQIFARADIGLGGAAIAALGIDFNYSRDVLDAWFTIVVMDVWHWTSLIVLLAYSGLRAIDPAFYRAAQIDGASRWQVFRFVELPKLAGVLTIGIMLRLMDSLMIYSELVVLTGGGPGSSTSFLSQTLVKKAIGQFDLGPAASFSIIYFMIIVTLCFVFFRSITRAQEGE